MAWLHHRIDLVCAAGWDITGKQSNHNQCGQYRAEDLSVSGHFAKCRQLESCPETGLEEINGDLRDADFWPASIEGPCLGERNFRYVCLR